MLHPGMPGSGRTSRLREAAFAESLQRGLNGAARSGIDGNAALRKNLHGIGADVAGDHRLGPPVQNGLGGADARPTRSIDVAVGDGLPFAALVIEKDQVTTTAETGVDLAGEFGPQG